MRNDNENEIEFYKKRIKEIEDQKVIGAENTIERRNLERENFKLNDLLKETEKRAQIAEEELKNARLELTVREDQYNEKLQILETEIKAIREKEIQLSELNAKNRQKQKKFTEELDAPYINSTLNEMLNAGKSQLDSIKSINLDVLSMKEKIGCLNKLFKVLLEEKNSATEKYEKLLELHNQLIELNSKNEEVFNPSRIQELVDENSRLKNQLDAVHQRYEYF